MNSVIKKNETKTLVNKGLLNLDLITYVVEAPCPECGGEMRAYIELDETESPRCAPVCIHKGVDEFNREIWTGCGYRSLNKREAIMTDKLYTDSLKFKTLNIFENGSIWANSQGLGFSLENYAGRDATSKKALELALKTTNEILEGIPAHLLLTGTAGAGKTHLATGILRAVMEKSNYDKKVMFVSYAELYNKMKFAVQDRAAMKHLTQAVIADIKTVDAVVIDDIASELGVITKDTRATDYNIQLLQQILEARVDKATIFTTNLSSRDIKRLYGDRILSRMLSNISDNQGEKRIVVYENTKDGRMVF